MEVDTVVMSMLGMGFDESGTTLASQQKTLACNNNSYS